MCPLPLAIIAPTPRRARHTVSAATNLWLCLLRKFARVLTLLSSTLDSRGTLIEPHKYPHYPSKMPSFIRALLALSFLLVSLYGQDQTQRIYSADNAYFEILSHDPISLSWMERLSAVIASDLIQLTGFHNSAIQRKIIVELQPSESSDTASAYQIKLDPRGYHKLHLKWSERLTVELAIQALCDVFLKRYRYNTFGLRQSHTCTYWLQTALQQWLYIRLYPAERLTLKNQLSQDPSCSLAQSLTTKTNSYDLNPARWECLALLELIRQMSPNKKSLQATLAHYLGTGQLKTLLETTFPELSNQSLDTWWFSKRKDISISASELCESMAVSRRWLNELATFQGLQDQQNDPIDLKQLWSEREQPLRKKHVAARMSILQARLQEINPTYFNAARALNAVFYSVLYGQTRSEFTHYLLEFKSQMDDTSELNAFVRMKLREP